MSSSWVPFTLIYTQVPLYSRVMTHYVIMGALTLIYTQVPLYLRVMTHHVVIMKCAYTYLYPSALILTCHDTPCRHNGVRLYSFILKCSYTYLSKHTMSSS